VVSFSLTDEHEALRQTVREFARDVVAPVIGGYYEREEFPYEVIAKMGQLGLFGLPFPEQYDGMGGDYLAFCLALHELARVDSSVAITLEAAVALGAMPIYRYGSAEQRDRWLPELCRGERLAAFGLTEPGGGSDIPGGMRTTACLDGDEWVINGSKAFITNSGTSITSVVTVLAITGREDGGGRAEDRSPGQDGGALTGRSRGRYGGRPEISAIIMPADTPGLTVAPAYSKVGWCASDTRELSFSDCRVPAQNLLGGKGRGYAQFLRILDEGRIAIAALAAGLAQGCVDECVRYAGERTAFGHRIGHYQAIQFKIADMAARAAAARLAWYDAAARLVAGQPVKMEAAIAKLTGSNAAMDNARDATQVFGGYGYMNEFPVARFYRDAKVLEIGEGTSEVQRMIIARQLGLAADKLPDDHRGDVEAELDHSKHGHQVRGPLEAGRDRGGGIGPDRDHGRLLLAQVREPGQHLLDRPGHRRERRRLVDRGAERVGRRQVLSVPRLARHVSGQRDAGGGPAARVYQYGGSHLFGPVDVRLGEQDRRDLLVLERVDLGLRAHRFPFHRDHVHAVALEHRGRHGLEQAGGGAGARAELADGGVRDPLAE
jgi:alkylation response protein AidB-like acyl-CoA dehydrogenase